MYTDNRDAYRQLFFDVWHKHQKSLPLQPVEQQVLTVILAHPEYHTLLDHPKQFMAQEFELEENPFFHMSLHIAVHEQLALDRPVGVCAVYQQLLSHYQTPHDAEHQMVMVLARVMLKAQQQGVAPDENDYLDELRAGE